MVRLNLHLSNNLKFHNVHLKERTCKFCIFTNCFKMVAVTCFTSPTSIFLSHSIFSDSHILLKNYYVITAIHVNSFTKVIQVFNILPIQVQCTCIVPLVQYLNCSHPGEYSILELKETT